MNTMNVLNFSNRITSRSEAGYSIFAVHKLLVLILILLFPTIGFAQTQGDESTPSARGAFWRSMAVPGWGHHYVDSDNWTRGQYHLAGEVVLVLSYFGLDARANQLENDYTTLALSKAGADLSGKNRNYRIAIGSFDNLEAYNKQQLRTRNWDILFPETPEYQWDWDSRESRIQYQDARERVDRNRSQLPTLIALMVTNRLVSGLSAYIRARDKWENVPEASFSYINEFGEPGVTANLRFSF
jgi:hypothetical protein